MPTNKEKVERVGATAWWWNSWKDDDPVAAILTMLFWLHETQLDDRAIVFVRRDDLTEALQHVDENDWRLQWEWRQPLTTVFVPSYLNQLVHDIGQKIVDNTLTLKLLKDTARFTLRAADGKKYQEGKSLAHIEMLQAAGYKAVEPSMLRQVYAMFPNLDPPRRLVDELRRLELALLELQFILCEAYQRARQT